MLHAWTSARYVIPLPVEHRFPIAKYARLRDGVIAQGLVAPDNLHEPARVEVSDLLAVHTHDYVNNLTTGPLSSPELRRLGFP